MKASIPCTLHRVAGQRVEILQALLPSCMFCKKIRDRNDHWQPIESYIGERSEAPFPTVSVLNVHGAVVSRGHQGAPFALTNHPGGWLVWAGLFRQRVAGKNKSVRLDNTVQGPAGDRLLGQKTRPLRATRVHRMTGIPFLGERSPGEAWRSSSFHSYCVKVS